jgi:HEXXH motif-containing protein
MRKPGARDRLRAVIEAHDLTVPESSGAVRRVLSAALRRLAQELARLKHPELEPVRALFVRELAAEPGRAFAILRRPNVGALVRTMRDPSRIDELAPALAATLALEMDHAGIALPALSFERTPARVLCSSGRFVVPGGGRASLAAHVWESDRPYDLREPSDRPFHTIDGGVVLALADDNPLAMLEAHPDKQGNAIDLGGQPVGVWLASLREALAIVAQYLPVLREEMEIVVHHVVPVGFDERKHLSASYREAIGTIYLTLHPSVMTMAEALIHEFSHNKLNALFELDPVLENAFEPLFASPVRPDPRPLHGVLLAVHAFLPVAELYRRMIAASDVRARPERFEQIVRGNREGCAVLLEHARPTRQGRPLMDEIRRLDATFA